VVFGKTPRAVRRKKLREAVKSFNIGSTSIRITDNYCSDKAEDDVQTMLGHISRVALGALSAFLAHHQNDIFWHRFANLGKIAGFHAIQHLNQSLVKWYDYAVCTYS
jgi:hypothetical protein